MCPDVLVTYTAKPVIYGSLAARMAGVPKRASLITGLGYLFSHGSWKRNLVGALGRAMYRVALRGSHCVIFQNEDDRSDFQHAQIISSKQASVIVNGSGVDLSRFQPEPLPDEPVFLMIARLLIDKGVREYAVAAEQVKKRFPQARFLLVGWLDDNPDSISEEELNGWIERGAIEFLGFQDDVRESLRLCSIYVLPSYREGTPRTVLEAMAMQRAIITTDVPGCRQTIVDDVSGLLVPARNAEALAIAMTRMIEAPEMVADMGRETLLRVRKKYDVKKVNKAIMAAIDISHQET